MSLSLAMEVEGMRVMAHVHSEIAEDPLVVISKHWPASVALGPVKDIDEPRLRAALAQYIENETVEFLVGAGPPPRDASDLNSAEDDMQGRQFGLYRHVPRILNLLHGLAPGRVSGIMESTEHATPDIEAFSTAAAAAGIAWSGPYMLCSSHWMPIARPGLWWMFGHLQLPTTALCRETGRAGIVHLTPAPVARTPISEIIEPGWFSIMETRQDNDSAVFHCLAQQNRDAQAPDQYAPSNTVKSEATGEERRLLAVEEERLSGYPAGYTEARDSYF